MQKIPTTTGHMSHRAAQSWNVDTIVKMFAFFLLSLTTPLNISDGILRSWASIYWTVFAASLVDSWVILRFYRTAILHRREERDGDALFSNCDTRHSMVGAVIWTVKMWACWDRNGNRLGASEGRFRFERATVFLGGGDCVSASVFVFLCLCVVS